MPPKKIIEYTAFLIDCQNDIDKKLDQLYSIFSTKVFYRQTKIKPVDRHQIILINTSKENSVEALTDWSIYQLSHLRVVRNSCVVDNNDDLEKKPYNHNNLLKGIHLAISSLSEIEDKKNILIKRIVILTDLLLPINQREEPINKLKTQLKACNATLYIVGVEAAKIPKLRTKADIKNLFNLHYLDKILDTDMNNNLSVFRKLSDQNILVLNYEEGFHLLFAYKAQIKDPYPWYVSLGIGRDFRVPVMCYKTTRKHFNVKMHRPPVIQGLQYTTDKAWFDLNTHEEVPTDDIVRGYKYHGKFVSFTPEQEEKMEIKKKSNKCLSILAFVDANQIPLNLYCMDNSMNKVKPDRRSVRGKLHGFRLFVAALRTKNVVAIVKRVYNNGNRPNLFAMFPCPEHQTNNYMLMCQLPYAHQFKDRYHRGTVIKEEETDGKIKEKVYNFLDAMTAGNDHNGKPIHPLAEKLKFNMNRARQYKFYAKKGLEEDPGNPPVLTVPSYLADRAEEYADFLLQYLEE